MKRRLLSLLMVAMILPLFAQVNGTLVTMDDKTILKVWGTHYERGYAQGYLIGDRIFEVFDGYLVRYALSNNPTVYGLARTRFLDSFTVDTIYRDEAQGMIQGMIDGGHNLYDETLARDLDTDDILMANTLIDLIYLMNPGSQDQKCSSLSAWGDASPGEGGDLVYMRFLDWQPSAVLTQNPLLLAEFPSEADEIPWISFTYPGMFGALSGINLRGTICMLNMGNYHGCEDPTNLSPVLLVLRAGIEKRDSDGDESNTSADVVTQMRNHAYGVGTITHAADGTGNSPVIIEANYIGVETRDDSFEDGLPAHTLAATNHFRTLYEPVNCNRYQGIVDSLAANPLLTGERAWNLLKGAAHLTNNMMAIEYVSTVGEIRWATRSGSTPAYQRDPSILFLTDLLNPDAVDDPASGMAGPARLHVRQQGNGVDFGIDLDREARVSVEAFNIRGQNVGRILEGVYPAGKTQFRWNPETVTSGVYLFRLTVDGKASCTVKTTILR